MIGTTTFALPVSPSVRLSPNASYLVTARVKPASVTLNEQLAWRCCASCAVQLTEVVPSGKVLPEGCVQVVVTGAAPAVTVGLGYVTAWPAPRTSWTPTSLGHAIWGGCAAGVGPGLELPPHACSTRATPTP